MAKFNNTKQIKLMKPSLLFSESFIEAIVEFQGENRELDLDTAQLKENFREYLQKIKTEEDGLSFPAGYVPASTFWLIGGEQFIGKVSIRHRLNETLIQMGGHISYQVRPSKRKLGYGSIALALALPMAKKLGLDKVLITCSDDNVGSWKIIEKNGGILENKIIFNDILKRRYWISL